MPIHARKFVWLLGLLALVATGCVNPLVVPHKSLLQPAKMSSDSIVLEMFFARFPFGDNEINETLWQQIDEQSFSPDLRERLARNGFRVGLLTGQIPPELVKLLELDGKAAPSGENEGTKVEDAQAQPRVVRRHLQIRPAQRSEIIASSVYAQLPVLVCESGQVSGQTYNQAQGLFAVHSYPQPDGRIRLELVPELHHDQPRQRWIGGHGMLRLDSSRPRQVYDDMKIIADLPPGAMLILCGLPNRPGSLGHHYFSESDSRLEQKLLVIRLAQTQHDPLFVPPETLKIAE